MSDLGNRIVKASLKSFHFMFIAAMSDIGCCALVYVRKCMDVRIDGCFVRDVVAVVRMVPVSVFVADFPQVISIPDMAIGLK